MTTVLLDATVTERFCAPFVMQAMVFISFFEPRRALQALTIMVRDTMAYLAIIAILLE